MSSKKKRVDEEMVVSGEVNDGSSDESDMEDEDEEYGTQMNQVRCILTLVYFEFTLTIFGHSTYRFSVTQGLKLTFSGTSLTD